MMNCRCTASSLLAVAILLLPGSSPLFAASQAAATETPASDSPSTNSSATDDPSADDAAPRPAGGSDSPSSGNRQEGVDVATPPAGEPDSKKPDSEKAGAATAADPDISEDHLRLRIKPLTRAELAVEAAAWRELLKAKVREISDLQIGVQQDATSADRPERIEQLPALQDERAKLIDRLNIVLDAWEKRGGDVEEYRQYQEAVGGLDLGQTDFATTWAAIKGWITSENGGQRWLWNLTKFALILLAAYLLATILSKAVGRISTRVGGTSELLRKFLAGFVKQLTLLMGAIVAASALEINISPLLAAIGGTAFVVGLALQGTLSNFASGLIILGYRPFDVGDVVDAGGVTGIVDSMTLISTRIRTFDNKVMIVPNNKIAGDTITNVTASETRRVDMTFGIGYRDDIDKATAIIENVLKQHPLVLDEPAPVIQMNELGDSAVILICRPWAKSSDYGTVLWGVMRSVKDEFDRQGISFPYPQRDVHVFQKTAEEQG